MKQLSSAVNLQWVSGHGVGWELCLQGMAILKNRHTEGIRLKMNGPQKLKCFTSISKANANRPTKP